MRNYVIINGVNSLTIQGLAIKTLPPITKPIQRNLREEIDGRDGDIVTTLGYGAYDKTIEIGLFGTFDIDEVIAYFNQKGTITFSNEADKVYNFQALEQVDYAELLKFRTANVVLHCQPFKYPLNETPLVEEYEYVEATGTDITLDNTSEAIFNKIDLLGNTSQNGTPTPSSPIPINVVSGDNTIEICGKNLVNDIRVGKAWNNNSNADRAVVYATIQPNTQYTISFKEKDSDTILYYFEKTSKSATSITKTITGVNQTTTITTQATSGVLGIQINKTSITLEDIEAIGVQIEKGSTATTYEPYIGHSYHITLPSGMFLGGIGNYVDFIFKAINGNSYYDSLTQAQKDELTYGSWYLHKEIGKVVLDGSENWYVNNQTYRINNFGAKPFSSFSVDNVLAYSNYFKWLNGNSGTFVDGAMWYILSGNELCLQKDQNPTSTTLATFKSWLATNKPIVYYVLATPTNTEITDTTLLEQLEAIKNAISYKGQTNITQVSNDLPFILDLSALKENSDHLVIDNIGNIYSKLTLDLEGTGIVDIYLNDTQMFEVDLSEKNEIVIDTQAMEAYNPTDNTLANRQVTGDYSKFKLDSGENDLRFSGDLTKATITRYVRWL